jgi:transposase-like protein
METQSISPSSPARRRKHYSTAEKESILDAFEQSGLSAKAFCQQRDICVATLANWRRQRREKNDTGFVCLDLPGPTTGGLQVRLPNGIEIRAPLAIAPATLGAWCEQLYRVGSR